MRMPEPKVHFLNVKLGDCFLLERPSGRLTVIDICAGNTSDEELSKTKLAVLRAERPRGNYAMCSKPTNPIQYLEEKGLTSIWRFILTHPDMDHMDGIKRLFDTNNVEHFWDCGIRRDKPDFAKGGPYLEDDWDFYEDLIAGKVSGTKVISPRAGDTGKYWNSDDDDGNGDGDYISIVSPNDDLISSANDDGDVNDASYVIVYRSCAGRIIFAGDSNDKTWEYILAKHKNLVSDAAVLFAPHHGRKSDRDYAFLDIVKPRVSFFGCAPSEHLAYSAWQYRNLPYFTNNQCGNAHIYPNGDDIEVFIENEQYARDYTVGATFQKDGCWFLCRV
jgi:beta-lactamase superfamily II metal-dependent hydrolase